MVNEQRPMRAELMARQQAKVALAVAVGQLYKIAAEDARAIAPMQLLNSTAPNGWVGVWDTSTGSETSNFLGTLVSQDPQGRNQQRVLFANDSLHPEVYAPEVSTGEGGAYAYYISDESMKVQVGTGESGLQSFESPVEDTPFVYHSSGLGAYFELLNPGLSDDDFYTIDPRSSEDFAFTSRIQNLDNLDFSPAAQVSDIVYSEQDVTVQSLGVLSKTNGEFGLMEDLSLNPGLLGTGLEAWLDYESYMYEPDENLPIGTSQEDPRRLFKMQGYSNTTPQNDEFVHVVAPIITDFGIQFSPKNTGDPITAQMRFVLELWNPYAQALDLEEMELRIRGIPDIEVIPVNYPSKLEEPVQEYPGSSFVVKTMDIFGESVDDADDAIVVKLDYEVTPSKSDISANAAETRYWPPGRMLYWAGKNNALSAGRTDDGYAVFGTRNSMDARYSLPLLPAQDWPSISHNRVRYEIPASDISVELILVRDGTVLQKLDSLAYYDVSSDYLAMDWRDRYVTFQTRKMERGNVIDHPDPSVWIRNLDPRDLNSSFGHNPELDNYTTPGGTPPDPLEHPTELRTRHYVGNTSQVDERFLFNRVLSNSPSSPYVGNLFDPILYDLPTRPILSVGELQHAYVFNAPLYAVGNQWGGDLNEIFDTHFFSGQNQVSSEEDEDPLMLHPAYRTMPENRGKANLEPEDLFVSGRFNVNSLNAGAWAAMLSAGSPHDFRYHEPDTNLMDDADDITLRTANALPPVLTRFPFSMPAWMGINPDYFYDEATDPPIQFFQEGYKFFGNRLNEDQLLESAYDALDVSLAEALSNAIVETIRVRGVPVFSLSDLVVPRNSDEDSILEQALSQVPELRRQIYNGDGVDNTQAVDPLLPAFTLPSDVMTLIAPVSSVRGDTFRIRTYGRLGDSDIIDEAYCEAIVQRLPELERLGGSKRKFEVISYRWIEKEDI
ncbi:MAG: hypothetical protein ACPGN3_18225 [Opitutales bacterium]